jgi:hypothetical protein
MVGVWIAPVIAQLMMVLFAMVALLVAGCRPSGRAFLANRYDPKRWHCIQAENPPVPRQVGSKSGQILPARRRGFTLYSKFCRLGLICLGILSAAFSRLTACAGDARCILDNCGEE